MNQYVPIIPAEFVLPLNMNGLRGRMLRLPTKKAKKREILLIYGHHASIERYYGLAKILNNYGTVTMPDLPGFGGMDSFYKIGQKPDLDTLADYLATFVRWSFKGKRLTIIGYSFGFLVITRMLQKYPDIIDKVDLLVSGAGFVHKDDFAFSRPRYLTYRYGSAFFAGRFTSLFFRYVAINSIFLRLFYSHTHNAKHKFANLTKEQENAMTEFEIHLWHCNDARTYMKTTNVMMTVDNCQTKIDLPLWHVWVEVDKYFNSYRVEQHLNITFNKVHKIKTELKKHSTNIIADSEEWSILVPPRLRQELNRKV